MSEMIDAARAVFCRRSGHTPVSVSAMPGGASTRKYFRATYDDGVRWVAMFVPEGGKAEEIQKGGEGHRWPFLEVRDLLEARGVRVPKIFAEYTQEGWLLLEDLGDDTLANHLLANPGVRESLYQSAVTDLARAQQELATLPSDCVVKARAFDADLLEWEIQHFREWGVEARGIAMTAEDATRFGRVARAIAERIAKMHYGFTHRDYQSRNLMVQNGKLVWIDFQDALLGPRVYDLVALLNDSYQEFDRAFVEKRLGEYSRARGLGESALVEIIREFDLVTVQRKLKDAGRFVFIDRTKNNPSFLRFVEPTIKKVRGAIRRLAGDAEIDELHGVLTRTLGDNYGS